MGGRIYEYVDDADAKAIRKAAASITRPKLFEVMAVGMSKSHWHNVLSGRDRMTHKAAERLRTGLHKLGAEIEPSRAIVVKRERHAITLSRKKPGPRPRASLEVLGPLRLDARHVLESRFGGNVPAMARALEMTASDLERLVHGTHRPSADEALSLSGRIRAITTVAQTWDPSYPQAVGGAVDPPEVRARRLLAKFAPEAFSIVLQLAAQGGP